MVGGTRTRLSVQFSRKVKEEWTEAKCAACSCRVRRKRKRKNETENTKFNQTTRGDRSSANSAACACLMFTQHSALSTLRLETQHLSSKAQHATRNNQRSIPNSHHSPLSARHSTLNTQRSTLEVEPWTMKQYPRHSKLQTLG